jgi:hypothetical protein
MIMRMELTPWMTLRQYAQECLETDVGNYFNISPVIKGVSNMKLWICAHYMWMYDFIKSHYKEEPGLSNKALVTCLVAPD